MEINAYRCKSCGKLHYPKYYACQECGGRDFDAEILRGAATLLTWTRVFSLPAGFDDKSRSFGIVKFDNGITATGVLDIAEIESGMRVESTVDVIRKSEDGDTYGLVFKPL